MAVQTLRSRGMGWIPDVPDFRDQTEDEAGFRRIFCKMAKAPIASEVDLREFFPTARDQGAVNSSAAHACLGLYEYFESRTLGGCEVYSDRFLYEATRALHITPGDSGASLRNTLKTMARCGVPPERIYPEDPCADLAANSVLMAFQRDFRGLRYVRIDRLNESGSAVLERIRRFLTCGVPCVLGFPVPSSLGDGPEIPFRPLYDAVIGGQAVVVVGLNDGRTFSAKGALLVRNSWGPTWGDGGYGWLPYEYITRRLARDVWTLCNKRWPIAEEIIVPSLDNAVD